MKFVLIIAACLSHNGAALSSGDCREEHISMPEITNQTGCHLAAQMKLRDWTRSHLDWKLTDAYCDAESTASVTTLSTSSSTATQP